MSVQSEINRLKQVVSNSYTAIGNKGGTVPSSKVSDNLVSSINSIPKGMQLNFDVIAYATLDALMAAAPAANTIGVVTSTPVTGWIFSKEQPTNMSDGMVWFPVKTNSYISFEALQGDNSIMLYPLFAKQYINVQFVEVPIYSYTNGQWDVWWDGELYSPGKKYEKVTGGWVNIAMPRQGSATSTAMPTMQESDSGMQIKCDYGGIVRTENKIDLTNYSRLCFTGDLRTSGSRTDWMRLCVWSDMGTYWIDNIEAQLSSSNAEYGTQYLPLGGIDGEYYIGFAMYASGCLVESLTLEREGV